MTIEAVTTVTNQNAPIEESATTSVELRIPRAQDFLQSPNTEPGRTAHLQDAPELGNSEAHGNTALPYSLEPGHILGMKKWEGRVLEVENDLLTAELSPLDHEGPSLQADFELNLLAPDDTQVQVGDTIYLTVRTIQEKGYRSVTSTLRLRRVGKWSELELAQARSRAKRRQEAFQQYVE